MKIQNQNIQSDNAKTSKVVSAFLQVFEFRLTTNSEEPNTISKDELPNAGNIQVQKEQPTPKTTMLH